MATKSSEIEGTIEGANTEVETKELSTDFSSLTLEKHKSETDSADKEEEEEEDGEEGEEEEDEEEEDDEESDDKDSVENDQEWDVDSFEGVEFISDDEMDDEEWRRYVRQCYKSEGFDVELDYLPTKNWIYSGFNPVKLDSYFGPPDLTGRAYMENMVKVVINKYNQSKEKNLVLVKIVRTVVKMAVGVKAYITFLAKESPEGEPVEYQGKAEWKVWQRNIHPILCRPASQQRQRD